MWWKEHLIKFRGEATTGGNLNAMGDKGKTKGDKGKGRFKNGSRKGKYGSVPRPKMEKVQDALDDGDMPVFVMLIHTNPKFVWSRYWY
eukprot:SAG11_NODE_22751_length_400_cov_3.501661_1_plen_88_part_00